jgi:hypothetical protein
MHAFDENLKDTVKNLFADTVRLYDENGLLYWLLDPSARFFGIGDVIFVRQ